MSVWVEEPRDGGSAVWGCQACDIGGWCSDHTVARIEARTHARRHDNTIEILGRHRGHHPTHDHRIRDLRQQGLTIRAIATIVGFSAAGVSKALRRIKERA